MSMQLSLFDTIQSHIKNFEDQLHTGFPAVVERYNPSQCTVDCYPAIYKLESDGLLIKETLLQDVPLIFPSTSKIALTFPIEKGDTVWVQCGMTDMDAWLGSNNEFEAPQTMRKHNINDAVAIAGIHKYSNQVVKNPDSVNLYFEDSSISINPDGSVDINVSDKFSVSNSTGELVAWVSELAQKLSEVTVNTIYGPSPINNKADVEALKAEIDTMKK